MLQPGLYAELNETKFSSMYLKQDSSKGVAFIFLSYIKGEEDSKAFFLAQKTHIYLNTSQNKCVLNVTTRTIDSSAGQSELYSFGDGGLSFIQHGNNILNSDVQDNSFVGIF